MNISTAMRIRVVLDTCIVRGQMHSPQNLNFLHSEAVAVSIPDIAIAETVVALLEERIEWVAFKGGLESLRPLLDPTLPVLPTGNDLAFMVGLIPEDPSPDFPAPYFGRAIWRLISCAGTSEDMGRGIAYRGPDGRERRVLLNLGIARQVLDQARRTWVHDIENARALLTQESPSQAEILGAVLAGMEQAYGQRGEKLEGMAAVLARFYSLALAPCTPYNPSSSARRGDAFDFALLQALALPAVICTMDRRLIRHMRETGTESVRQLLTIEELRAHLSAGTLGSACLPREPAIRGEA